MTAALMAIAAGLTIAVLLLLWRWRNSHLRQHEALRAREEHLTVALWGSGEQFWDFDLARRELHLLHADESEPHLGLGLTVTSRLASLPLVHPHDRPSLRRRLRAHLRGRDPLFTSEHRVDPDGDGNWVWIRVHGRTVERDARGHPRRLAGTARDTTANRHAEAERRIASEVLRSMSEAVAVLDRELHFVAVNPAFSQITGYSDVEALGRPFTMLDSDHSEGRGSTLGQDLGRQHWQGNVWMTRRDGEEILCHVKHNAIPDAGGEINFHVVVLSDITEQKRAEQELRYLANYDALTSLPNRSLLSERLARAIVRARREGGHVAVLFLDLDRFKDVNDSLGHATGDRVLRAAAERVQHAVGPQHTVARLGGDEFTVVLEGLATAQEAEHVAQRVIESFSLPLTLDEHHEITVSPSIGISLFPDHAQVPTELLKHADTAMYQAKAAGRRTWQVYSASMDEATRRRATLAGLLRRVVERDELTLVYQPRYSLHEQRVVGAEALLRWRHPEFGLVPPDQFIPLAEDTGLILEIGEWVLKEACTTLRQWQSAGLDGMRMSVNVSAIQLLRGDLASTLARILAETGVASGQLELELTESAIMANVGRSASVLHACRALGVGVAVDDFGTGYSSLAYLKRLPLTTLKIDQEFVGDLTRDPDDEAITSTVIAMGHSLSLTVVAEGVETAGQLKFLRDHGCDEVQGHYIAAAMDRDACMAFLSRPAMVPA
ncbi:putative bifunctional diguanylate cyclase/phosphodiesterase [Pseudoxanthomonas suwonensis]|uniref:cyclic-guanylate-specific phosphodiesterase n=1 Tax=Pseudoxanthomonas suwonensis TaxID=314722 RepID=A0A0E3YZY2_9GAMM|nr:EAL domain-containing protein [Pseudoxanthomonas suwonensis]AKC86207.1 sensor protein [Pseudoxanthomonas suwonensis]